MSENFENKRSSVIDGEYKDVTGKTPEGDTTGKKAKKKSSGKAKKVWGAIGLAIVFGLTASFVFNISNMAVEKLNKTGKNATGVIATDDNDTSAGVLSEDEIRKIAKDELSRSNSLGVGTGDAGDTIAVGSSTGGNVTQVAAEAMPSIVAITNKSVQEVRSFYGMGVQQYESTAAGSGIIIGKNDTELLIVTNAHVVEDANTLSVCFIDNEVCEAKTKGTDDENDLAIIAVALDDIAGSTLDSIKIATIGSSNDLQIGEQVVAIGNALGYGQSVTTGIVSALDRTIGSEDEASDSSRYIQTDAAINPGNSGGALLNMKGEVVGINSAKLANTMIEGMGYAIPIDAATPILDNLMSLTTRSLVDENEAGYLGISGFSVTDDVAKLYNIPKGVYVSDTYEGSAARMAGIQQGDVIVRFDGMSVDSINKLRERLDYYRAGETVEVVVARADEGEYKEKSINVILGNKSSIKDGATSSDNKNNGGNLKLPGNNAEEEQQQEKNAEQDNQQNDQQEGKEYSITIPNNIFDIFGW